jgi:hypothetical protein
MVRKMPTDLPRVDIAGGRRQWGHVPPAGVIVRLHDGQRTMVIAAVSSRVAHPILARAATILDPKAAAHRREG